MRGKISTTSFWMQRTNPTLRNPCAMSFWKLGGSFWRCITTCQLCSHAFLSTHCCDKRLDKRLDKMLLHLLMMGQLLNISLCLHYASICSQQVISGYRQPTSAFRDWALFFLPLAHYGNLHSHVIGGVVPCICSVYRETADPAVKKWIWKDGGKLHVYLVSPLHLRRSPAQERGQAQLWKSLWSLG